ncbi:hypothetical protein B5F77_14200 [Parabacteroides sp. An277]|uniref:hypothetical protein n=1 Tax=Parabacteroides sp. An277 TaxID=1965619 RepID=UPI000B3AC2B3|nr:hypothetical protein [Parabacteroides sp. An277]OUO49732.1 hypothetical protein B5F77_14200 [Parabacteroides sp. An277]
MEKFREQQEQLKEAREARKLSREKLGSFFYDLAKIVFTTLVVGTVVSIVTGPLELTNWILLSIGAMATALLAFMGYKIINIKIWNY